MQRSQRLRKVIQLSARELSDLEQRLLQGQRELAAYEAQSQDLQSAREEYAKRLHAQNGRSMSGSEVRTLLGFLAKVDEAIAQLGEQIRLRRLTHSEQQQLWLKARQKTQRMHEIADRHAQAERQAQLQREQRESDDRPRLLGE